MDAADFLRLVLDAPRLAVVGALAQGPTDADGLAARSGIPRRTVLETLGALVQGGLASRDGDGVYTLDRDALADLALSLPQRQPPASAVFYGMTDDERAVLARFFRGERLVEVPAQRAKRLVVLERIALEFEPGVHYPEREVDERIHRFHDDHATIRRYLVDEGFLDRAGGEYWRSGGRVD